MNYLTVKMIAAHAKKHPKTVLAALRKSEVAVENLGGRAGVRVTEANANRFLSKQWPDVEPINRTAPTATN